MSKPKYLIIGVESMIGRHLKRNLPEYETYGSNHLDYNLLDMNNCKKLFERYDSVDTVFNCVGFNGGLPLNLSRPADIYYESSQLNLNILKCCQTYKVGKVISIISACSYPDTDYAMKEEDLFNGLPNPSVECHGFVKRTIFEFGRQLYKQYSLNAISTILTNSYGDGDRFDLARTKVVGAAVRRICDAIVNKEEKVVFYGTGSPQRELIYAGDAAKCLIQIAENYNDPMTPINIGSGQIISIKDLISKIVEITGYTGTVMWDESKPDGQAIRMLDLTKMKKYITVEMTRFEVGLLKTIEYYMNIGRYLSR